MAKAAEFIDPTFKGVVGPQHFGGCYVESVDVNRSGFCPMSGSWDPAEVPIVDGVYADEDSSTPHDQFASEEQFEWGTGCQFVGRIN